MGPPHSTTSGKKGSSHLLGLATAAIVAVYAAGYVRTRPAAERFANESEERRGAPPAQETGPVVATSAQQSDVLGAAAATTSPIATVPAPLASASSGTATPAAASPRIANPVASGELLDAPVAEMPVPGTTATVASTAAETAQTNDILLPAVPPAPPSPQPAVVAVLLEQVPVAPPIPVAAAKEIVKQSGPQLRDGTYFGWGTSRHGNIQAAVEISGGKIARAYIARCLTRYSCNVISRLIPQVADRQSANVDYVSGATQSSNAFYQAVSEALAQAKG